MTPQADRFASLDVLRGLGILGILAVNAPFFAMPIAAMLDPQVLEPMDVPSVTAWSISHVFFERKFVTLFSMLFGASILLVGGHDKSDADRNRFIARRLGWLLLFGLIHGSLIWYGDILLVYAVAGFIAAQFRGWTPRRLFGVGAAIFFLFAVFEAANAWLVTLIPAEMMEQGMAMFSASGARAEVEAFRGALGEVQMANLANWGFLVASAVFYVPTALGLMLIGMGLLKTGVLTARRGVAFYLLLAVLGAAALSVLWWATAREAGSGFSDPVAGAMRESLNALAAPIVTLGYIGVICLIVKSPLRLVTGPLAATGQMAFTNYIAQSLIMTGIFWGARGAGLFGTMSYAELAAVVAGVWLLQLVWSPIWMGLFRYGPLEWVWRRLTYARPVPFRR